jgi:hypothetical protein
MAGDGSQLNGLLTQPPIDGRIPLDGTVEGQQLPLAHRFMVFKSDDVARYTGGRSALA